MTSARYRCSSLLMAKDQFTSYIPTSRYDSIDNHCLIPSYLFLDTLSQLRQINKQINKQILIFTIVRPTVQSLNLNQPSTATSRTANLASRCGFWSNTYQSTGVIIERDDTRTQLYSPSKAATIKKTNKTKKKKRNKTLQDKSNTTRQHISILGLIFSTQSTNDNILSDMESLRRRLDFLLLMHTEGSGKLNISMQLAWSLRCCITVLWKLWQRQTLLFTCHLHAKHTNKVTDWKQHLAGRDDVSTEELDDKNWRHEIYSRTSQKLPVQPSTQTRVPFSAQL